MCISHLFARIAEREAELACQEGALRVEIDQLTARLNNIERDLEHVQITRQTATSLADGLDQDAPSPAEPELTEHPLYPQLLEGVRSKLKRLVARGILTETEPGLFTQNRS
ncbi:hypothetical protein [Streptomyces scopuliridis]|uniref:hypothetical protein n=1 Tax=Streptomyces scopuliridis TaxID=452529 RepID=UPI0036819B76